MSTTPSSPVRRSAHIAMFNVATHGHVQPSIELIRELVARGHRVTYAVADSFSPLVAAAGAEPRGYDSPLNRESSGSWGTGLIDHLRLFLADSGRALPQLQKAYQDDRPDLVLYDPQAYAAPVLAKRWGIAAVQVTPMAVPWEGCEEDAEATVAASASGAVDDAEDEESNEQAAWNEATHDWLALNNLGVGPQRVVRRPSRCISLISRVVQPHADRVDARVYSFTGPCRPVLAGAARGVEGDEDWQRPTDAERVLLISLGTIFNQAPGFFQECVEAFGEVPGWHVVLALGRNTPPEGLERLPHNVEARTWVPQRAVLRQADAFITHAGAGSAHDGLDCGVPMVAVPQAADQFTNASMLEELGVARRLRTRQATAETLRRAVLGLLDDPRTAERFAAAQHRMAADGGTLRAADLVEAELPH